MPSRQNCRTYLVNALVFLCSYAGYALMHASRKSLSTVKPAMIAHLIPSADHVSITIEPSNIWYRQHALFPHISEALIFMGTLDFLFLLSYAVGLYISGWLGDRLDPRNVLCGGMLMSAATTFVFGVPSEWGKFYNRYWYACIWMANGILQGPGWPAGVALVVGRFRYAHGLVLGLWSTSAAVGNIIGSLIASAVIPYGYEYVFLTVSVLLAGTAVVSFCGIPPTEGNPHLTNSQEEQTEESNIPLQRVLLIPGVILYGLAYACLKLVNYSFFFWLPYYLHNKFNWDASVASALSAWYDVGGLLGGILAGGLSDLPCISRHWVNTIFLLACVPCLFGYRATPGDPMILNSCVMGLTGFVIAGPSNLLSAVMGADLSRMPHLRGKRILSTVTGFIDGTGSLGAAFGQLIVPSLQSRYGWSSVFYLFVACALLTLLFVIPPHIQSTRDHTNQADDAVSVVDTSQTSDQ